MSLDTLDRRPPTRRPVRPALGAGRSRLERLERRNRRRPALSTLVVLLLACVTLLTLDARGGDHSVVAPLRSAVGSVLGPAETATSAVVRPFAAAPSWFHSRGALRGDVAALQHENAALRQQLEITGLDRNRLAEYDALARTATDTGYTLVPAHVVGMGAAQSFSRTVTIDAGTTSGIAPDTTVVADDGLVGRVVSATATTATVLLVVDADSVVGGRVAQTMQVGLLHGRGQLGSGAALDLDLVDDSRVPAQGDVVVTWGSRTGAPYVAGIPVGRVTSVVSSPRDSAQHAVVAPYVDFGSLDLVGVVVPAGTTSDRSLVRPHASGR